VPYAKWACTPIISIQKIFSMYKKLVTISLFIFFAAVTATLTAGLVFYQNKQTNDSASTQQTLTPTDKKTAYTLVEVAKHTQESDCWMAIEGNVYNLTGYFGQHPGGDKNILRFCGKDGTQAYQGIPHSSYARSLLPPYLIGVLASEPSKTVAPKSTTTTSAQTSQKTTTTKKDPVQTGPKTYTMAEVAKHNNRSDCWQVIQGKAYNVTSFFGQHPGGDGNILKYCGKEATAAYEGLPHSSYAWSLLPPMFVGEMK
jgi:cytochrome b involved in lipid metabolism